MSDSNQRPRVVLVHRCFILNQHKQILFIQRAAGDSYGAGQWEVPGGKLDEGQDLRHALEREIQEETNLLASPISDLVYADSFVIGQGKYTGLPYVVLFGLAQLTGGQLTLSHEHDNYQWLNYHQALSLNLTPETHKALISLQKHLS